MNYNQHKVMVIGLDGATFDVLLPLSERGFMPNLARLMSQGSWGYLNSTIPPFTASAWSSFATGMNPGKHGLISFQVRDRFNYDLRGSGFVNAEQLKLTLWEIMSQEGKRVGVINVPVTYPARPVNGYMVTGMLTPPDSDRATYPAELKSHLGADYVFDLDSLREGDKFRLTNFPPKQEMLSQIYAMFRQRAATCLELLQTRPWDFFMVVFTSTDRIFHFFWDDLEFLLDESTVETTTLSDVSRGILAYFHELDETIGQLVLQAGPDATVLFVSDHGFGAAPTHRFYVNVWLEKLGLVKRRGPQGLFDLEYWRVLIGRNKALKAALRRFLPESTQSKLKTTTESASGQILDWKQTQVYFVPLYFHVCGVEVNVKGRHRDGNVTAGPEYEALCDQIIHAATRLEKHDGSPLVELAIRREALYTGTYVEEFPDVILVLDPDYIGAGSLAGTALIEPHSTPMRPGEHRQEGIFIAVGPDIERRPNLEGLNLIDVPATVLYAMGLPVPVHFDSQVMTDIFSPACLCQNPIQTKRYEIPEVAPSLQVYSGKDQVRLEARLRSLGYLD
jgi:predicted AlkP superfamily phosphohydrolase/phosphomutase